MTTTGVPHRDFFCVGNVRFTSIAGVPWATTVGSVSALLRHSGMGAKAVYFDR